MQNPPPPLNMPIFFVLYTDLVSHQSGRSALSLERTNVEYTVNLCVQFDRLASCYNQNSMKSLA